MKKTSAFVHIANRIKQKSLGVNEDCNGIGATLANDPFRRAAKHCGKGKTY
jgi:hypothetical protein